MNKNNNKYEEAKKLLENSHSNGLSKNKNIILYKNYINIIKKLAYRENINAQLDLAGHYEDMNFWGKENPYFNAKRRFYWYNKACKGGDKIACNNLAFLYETGDGCKQDLGKALELYKKSGLLGYSVGQKNYNILKRQIEANKYVKNEKGIYVLKIK